MLHLTSDPTWAVPDTAGSITRAVLYIGGAIVVIALLAALILFLSKRRGAAGIAAFTALIALMTAGATAASGSLIAYENAEHAHDMSVASWLKTNYGATVDRDLFELTGDTIQETTASLGGRPVIIKLARTTDGHIAVFSSDDKPLARKH